MELLEYKPEYTKEYLYSLYKRGVEEALNNPMRVKALKSILSRKLPHYGVLKKYFPMHIRSFKSMHRRSKRWNGHKISETFKQDINGFINFIIYLGPVPYGMDNPTIGRIDHSKGYVEGNFLWQSAHDNLSEVGHRNWNERKTHLSTVQKHWKIVNFYKENPTLFSWNDMITRFYKDTRVDKRSYHTVMSHLKMES